MKTITLLVISNIFMTVAWYGHLKYKSKPLILVILVSWSIALFEYIFQVPANRMGSEVFKCHTTKDHARVHYFDGLHLYRLSDVW